MTVWPQGFENLELGSISDITKAKLPTWPQPFFAPFLLLLQLEEGDRPLLPRF